MSGSRSANRRKEVSAAVPVIMRSTRVAVLSAYGVNPPASESTERTRSMPD